jgi:hypothetical protein
MYIVLVLNFNAVALSVTYNMADDGVALKTIEAARIYVRVAMV